MSEEFNKSIDEMIDLLFVEEETVTEEVVEKASEIATDSKTKADEVVAPKGEDDAKRNAGRPKQISSETKKEGDYDKDIKDRENKEEEIEEAKKQAKNPLKKSESNELTNEERAELEAFRKAKADAKFEELRKAQVVEQEQLIKSIVEKVTLRYEDKIENLQKSLSEQTAIVKAMANAPQRSKSVTNINTLEKSAKVSKQASFSKSEMLDAAEELFKAGKLSVDKVIELENNSYIYDEEARSILEAYMQSK